MAKAKTTPTATSTDVAELLTLAEIAPLLGVGVESARTYHRAATRHRYQGTFKPSIHLPAPDAQIGRTPVWKEQTIRDWQSARPGRTGKRS